MIELIKKKRKGEALNPQEIQYIIDGFITGKIPDYQISAFLMAICFQGMNDQETVTLTDAMMRSGDLIDLSEIKGIKVDKHSTGGVGDKTTIVLAPLVAAAGVPVAKMSGRGLGHTGGTIDKLESIPGFSVDMSRDEFISKIKKNNVAVCGQNAKLVPADKKLYALRDVTGTVDNVSLISSSIMSKKLACGADAIVIDIKVGEGAYMKTEEDATQLAKILMSIGAKMNRKVRAIITAMHQPLGMAIGNALEVKEAIETLKGNGPDDLTELTLKLGSHMLVLGNICSDYHEGRKILQDLIDSGKALEKFKEFVIEQGGNIDYINNTDLLPQSQYSFEYKSQKEGYIHRLDALDMGLASVKLGAGRETKTSPIDFGAGILLKKKIGDSVSQGETLAILYSNDKNHFEKAISFLDNAYDIQNEPPQLQPLIIKTMM